MHVILSAAKNLLTNQGKTRFFAALRMTIEQFLEVPLNGMVNCLTKRKMSPLLPNRKCPPLIKLTLVTFTERRQCNGGHFRFGFTCAFFIHTIQLILVFH